MGKIYLTTLLCILDLVLAACGQNSSLQIAEQTTAELSLPENMPSQFSFMSGAGAWATTIELNRDGSFSGWYYDANMGDNGPGYPYGSEYTCKFSGMFTNIMQINEYTYFMQLSSITVKDDVGREWIEDGRRYIASNPYGLEAGSAFILYTPETPVDVLDEYFLSWNWHRFSTLEEKSDKLCSFGLYNIEAKYGFFTDEINETEFF